MALHYDTYGVKDDDAYSSFSDDDSKHVATVYRGDDEFEVESSNDQDLTARVFRKIILDRSDTLEVPPSHIKATGGAPSATGALGCMWGLVILRGGAPGG